jgi:hypothetical protein
MKNVYTYLYQTAMHCITDSGTLKAWLSLCPNTTQWRRTGVVNCKVRWNTWPILLGERFLYTCGRVLESTRKAISTFIVTSFLLYIVTNGCVLGHQSLLLPPLLSRQHQAGQTVRASLARYSNNLVNKTTQRPQWRSSASWDMIPSHPRRRCKIHWLSYKQQSTIFQSTSVNKSTVPRVENSLAHLQR